MRCLVEPGVTAQGYLLSPAWTGSRYVEKGSVEAGPAWPYLFELPFLAHSTCAPSE